MERGDLIKKIVENPSLLSSETEPDPSDYENIEKFFEILKEKKEFGEKILVIGHEDIDGISSLYGIEILLKNLKLDFKTYLPSRENESYGISDYVIEKVKKENFDFLITLDCGLSNKKEIKLLREIGYDVFIIDHHSEGNFEEENLIHPFKGKGFPFLSTGVVVFLILYKEFKENLWKDKKFYDFIYLSGLSVLSDKVPVCGLNEFILNKAQIIFPETEIYKVFSKLNTKPPLFKEISKIISMVPAYKGSHLILEFLREEKEKKKEDLLKEMILKYIEEEGKFKEYLSISRNSNYMENNITYIISRNINPRFAGWIASKFLKENGFNAICITKKEKGWVGEARSKPPFSILKILKEVSYLFEEFGGHPFACGFTIKEENIHPFIENLKRLSKDLKNFIPEPDFVLDEKELEEKRKILEKIAEKGIFFSIKSGEKIYYSTKTGLNLL